MLPFSSTLTGFQFLPISSFDLPVSADDPCALDVLNPVEGGACRRRKPDWTIVCESRFAVKLELEKGMRRSAELSADGRRDGSCAGVLSAEGRREGGSGRSELFAEGRRVAKAA